MKPCFGGSGITEDVFQAICREIDLGDTVVEFGAGDASTPALASRFTTYTVEHDPVFLDKHSVTYIHAPLVNGWYSREILVRLLPRDYRLVLLDGPGVRPGDRALILRHTDLFRKAALYVVHDIQRPEEHALAEKIGWWLGRSVRWGDEFAII